MKSAAPRLAPPRCLLALALAAACARGERLRRQPAEGRLLCRLEPPAAGGGDRILEVWEQPGNVRLAEFQDTGSFESRVHCRGGAPACQAADPHAATDVSACAACPCELDDSRDTSESERAILGAVAPRCLSAAPADVLLLGLGGGVVHTLLRRSCPGGLRLRSAEIDPRFAAIASQFFGLPLEPGASEVVVGDALAVVRRELQARGTPARAPALVAEEPGPAGGPGAAGLGAAGWDVVVIDCFVGKGRTPDSCRSAELVDDVRGLLKPGGMVVHHMWHASPEDERVAPEFEATLQEYRRSFGPDAVQVHPIFRENPDLRLDDIIMVHA